MMDGGYLSDHLSRKTAIVGLKLWVVLGIAVGAFIVLILLVLSFWLISKKKPRKTDGKFPSHRIPKVCKEIQEVKVDNRGSSPYLSAPTSQKVVIHVQTTQAEYNEPESKFKEGAAGYVLQSLTHYETPDRAQLATSPTNDKGMLANENPNESTESAVTGVPQVSHLGWGNWYTLHDLDEATDSFSDSNVLGEGGYGIVYKGQLPDGTAIAVKNLLNNRGQAEREFRVEVEAIGRVRHKNLVRLLGYCAEGKHRMLVYEYVENGNLDQWLHGPISRTSSLSWDARMRIVLGTAKALAYLHEALEPKVVHRDIKSSNILIDSIYHAKISDFGLAKLLGAGKSHVTTRVMGTFGYVAPEYANTGLLNERSDVYSFGVLLMEVITGRDPVDYSRPPSEVNLVDWLKMMVGHRRSEEVADPNLQPQPSSRALKRALLVALRCVDPDSSKRPKMGHVVHMLEADEFPFRDERTTGRRPPEIPKARQHHPHHYHHHHQPHQPRQQQQQNHHNITGTDRLRRYEG